MLKAWWEALLNLVYPPRCPVCRKAVDCHGELCLSCLAAALAEREVNIVARGLKHLDSCRVLCDYTGGIRLLIHNIKFRQASRFALHLERLLDKHAGGQYLAKIDAVVPVPLHPDRLAERGYNQAEIIFRKWAENHGLPWLEALVRIRVTTPQWRLDLQDRRKNIKGAFSITRPGLVQKKNILLVDDILTSGATLNECARVLKQNGAASVTALALAGGTGR